MDSISRYQKARELADRLYATVSDRTPPEAVAQLGRLYVDLTYVEVVIAATLNELPPALAEQWRRELTPPVPSSAPAPIDDSSVRPGSEPFDVAVAVRRTFPDQASDIIVSEAFRSLIYWLRDYHSITGQTPTYVFEHLLDENQRSFVGRAADPAAYLAATVRDL